MRFDLETIIRALSDSVPLVTSSDAIRAGVLELTVDTLLNGQEARERRLLADRQAARKRNAMELVQANLIAFPIEQAVPIEDITLDPSYNVRSNERYHRSDDHLRESILSNGLFRRVQERNISHDWNPPE